MVIRRAGRVPRSIQLSSQGQGRLYSRQIVAAGQSSSFHGARLLSKIVVDGFGDMTVQHRLGEIGDSIPRGDGTMTGACTCPAEVHLSDVRSLLKSWPGGCNAGMGRAVQKPQGPRSYRVGAAGSAHGHADTVHSSLRWQRLNTRALHERRGGSVVLLAHLRNW